MLRNLKFVFDQKERFVRALNGTLPEYIAVPWCISDESTTELKLSALNFFSIKTGETIYDKKLFGDHIILSAELIRPEENEEFTAPFFIFTTPTFSVVCFEEDYIMTKVPDYLYGG